MRKIIRLLPQQIPFFWDAIKKASAEANQFKEKDFQVFFNNLLHGLLNDKSQCFILMDDNRILLGLIVTKIIFNKITGSKELEVLSAYLWEKIGESEWAKFYTFVREFAQHADCNKIIFKSGNPKIWTICNKLSIPEVSRNFVVEV